VRHPPERPLEQAGVTQQEVLERVERTIRKVRQLLAAGASYSAEGARRIYGFIRGVAHWGVFIALLGAIVALVTLFVQFEIWQADRISRSLEFVRIESSLGTSQREALEYLNHESDGVLCGAAVNWVSRLITRNTSRMCFVPVKHRVPLVGINAVGFDLGGADLANADLRRADLRGADLADANLTRADLRDADLRHANLTGAVLERAFMWETNLMGAQLTNANLEDAMLLDAYLVDSVLTGADLMNAFLLTADLAGANLTDADLAGANLMGADFEGAILTQPQLDSACGQLPPASIPEGLTWMSGPCPELSR